MNRYSSNLATWLICLFVFSCVGCTPSENTNDGNKYSGSKYSAYMNSEYLRLVEGKNDELFSALRKSSYDISTQSGFELAIKQQLLNTSRTFYLDLLAESSHGLELNSSVNDMSGIEKELRSIKNNNVPSSDIMEMSEEALSEFIVATSTFLEGKKKFLESSTTIVVGSWADFDNTPQFDSYTMSPSEKNYASFYVLVSTMFRRAHAQMATKANVQDTASTVELACSVLRRATPPTSYIGFSLYMDLACEFEKAKVLYFRTYSIEYDKDIEILDVQYECYPLLIATHCHYMRFSSDMSVEQLVELSGYKHVDRVIEDFKENVEQRLGIATKTYRTLSKLPNRATMWEEPDYNKLSSISLKRGVGPQLGVLELHEDAMRMYILGCMDITEARIRSLSVGYKIKDLQIDYVRKLTESDLLVVKSTQDGFELSVSEEILDVLVRSDSAMQLVSRDIE